MHRPDRETNPEPMLGVFRSVSEGADCGVVQRTQSATMRPPASVPYVVDNLWEWKRPAHFPSRRFSAFASPSAALAQASGPRDGVVCRVLFVGKFSLCQLQGWQDSKFHPECKSLPKLLLRELGREWVSAPISEKQVAGRLWIPCLTAIEVEALFTEVAELHRIRAKVEQSLRYWDSVVLLGDPTVPPGPEGELFFTAEEGYLLEKMAEHPDVKNPG